MDSDRLPRKLAAILYADVVDYSRLTGEDEDATHRRLRDYLDLISDNVEQQHGRVMHYAGDAVLAMFDAVSNSLPFHYTFMGEQKVKNIDKPVRVYRVVRNDLCSDGEAPKASSAKVDEQQILFCTSSDGVGIAYTTVGEGPPLVLHARVDALAPFEGGRKMAAMIPNARFVPLESANHLLIESEPAWPRFLAEVRSFLE